jgi:hypothetical protein
MNSTWITTTVINISVTQNAGKSKLSECSNFESYCNRKESFIFIHWTLHVYKISLKSKAITPVDTFIFHGKTSWGAGGKATIWNRHANSDSDLVLWLDFLCQSCVGNFVQTVCNIQDVNNTEDSHAHTYITTTLPPEKKWVCYSGQQGWSAIL